MKGLVPLVLVLLGLCFYEANALVCPSLVIESYTFISGSSLALRLQLESYNAPQEAVEAKMEVKKCIDDISFVNRKFIEEVMVSAQSDGQE
ncbi:PREDICTED: secretoglobin family 1D member-like [Dipodomys ordii]|uniref:Secretoglobin family 1D member-like n=1 Tax=Dipodomys ordii TaxID=10020 RepID=A0A1S3G846_DIPOR|nr:PREDICTED: secretoglobin family 1D member-like [Dipodomys ordii]